MRIMSPLADGPLHEAGQPLLNRHWQFAETPALHPYTSKRAVYPSGRRPGTDVCVVGVGIAD